MELQLLVGHAPGGSNRSSRRRDDRSSRAPRPAEGKSERNESKNDKTPPIPPGLLHIIVSIDKQRATLFADGAAGRKHGGFHRAPRAIRRRWACSR